MTRCLTKSRFGLANECPTKLFYADKDGYADAGAGDEFLAALAEGGFQVGALAQALFPDGWLVRAVGHDEALAETEALLAQDEVTLFFEPAFRHGSLFVRVDVLVRAEGCRCRRFGPPGSR